MKNTITTRGVDRGARSRHWHETIARAYFPLDLTFPRPEAFDGELVHWDLGEVSLSRLTSDPLLYRRLPKHFREPGPEEFLVTLPAKSEVRFAQGGKEVRANPGAFFIERSQEPYEFSHAEPADLWVMKLGKEMLGGRIRAPDRFCSLQFDATNGANGLFVDMVHLIPQRYDAMTEETRAIVGRQLVDLLALAIQSDERVLTSGTSTVRMAHLARIEAFVRRNIDDPDLGPDDGGGGLRHLAALPARVVARHQPDAGPVDGRGAPPAPGPSSPRRTAPGVRLQLADQVHVGADHAAQHHVAAARHRIAVQTIGSVPPGT
jgi:hypothetical protein